MPDWFDLLNENCLYVQVYKSTGCYMNLLNCNFANKWLKHKRSITTRPWTNRRSLWPRPHANISKAIWRTLRPPSCLSSGWGELVLGTGSNMPFCAWGVLMLMFIRWWKAGFKNNTACIWFCPKPSHEIEGVVPNRVRILGFFFS